MKAAPKVGDLYRQEYAIGVAEDMGKVVSLNQSVSVPFGTFKDCLKTDEFSPFDPGVIENKYYAKGVERSGGRPDTGERFELVEIQHD